MVIPSIGHKYFNLTLDMFDAMGMSPPALHWFREQFPDGVADVNDVMQRMAGVRDLRADLYFLHRCLAQWDTSRGRYVIYDSLEGDSLALFGSIAIYGNVRLSGDLCVTGSLIVHGDIAASEVSVTGPLECRGCIAADFVETGGSLYAGSLSCGICEIGRNCVVSGEVACTKRLRVNGAALTASSVRTRKLICPEAEVRVAGEVVSDRVVVGHNLQCERLYHNTSCPPVIGYCLSADKVKLPDMTACDQCPL